MCVFFVVRSVFTTYRYDMPCAHCTAVALMVCPYGCVACSWLNMFFFFLVLFLPFPHPPYPPVQICYLVEAVNASGRRAAMLRALSEDPMAVVPRLEAQMLADEEVPRKAWLWGWREPGVKFNFKLKLKLKWGWRDVEEMLRRGWGWSWNWSWKYTEVEAILKVGVGFKKPKWSEIDVEVRLKTC